MKVPSSRISKVYLKRAYRAYKAGRYQEVLVACREILQRDQRHASAWYGLGLAYQGLRRYRSALKVFHCVIKLKWHPAEAWVEVGHLHWWLREHALARRAYHQALRADPQQIQAHHWLGIVACNAKRYVEAKRHLSRVVHVQPTNAWALGYLGYIALLDKDWPKAVILLRRATRKLRKIPWFIYNLGLAHFECRQYDQARRNLKRFLKLAPRDADAHALLGLIALENGRQKLAIAYFRKALRHQPKHSLARRHLKYALRK